MDDPAVLTEAANNIYSPPIANWNNANTFQKPGSPDTSPKTPIPPSAREMPQLPFPSTENWQNTPPSELLQQANIQATWAPRPSPPPVSHPTNNLSNRSEHPPARQTYSSTRDRAKTTKIGFTIAGLCIITGSLLLVFAYLVGSGTTTTSDARQANTIRSSQTATRAVAPTSTIPPITPTPTLPGQSLLDTSVLSNNFNEQTGIQQSTNFKVNQKIYVILNLHPGGNIHTVCLNWSLSDASVGKFAFEVNPASNYNYYSYVVMTTAGNGHIDISLSSTRLCTNAIPAQKLSFTVSS